MDFYYDSNLSFAEVLADNEQKSTYAMLSHTWGDSQEANFDDLCWSAPTIEPPPFVAHETQCDWDPNLADSSESRFGWSWDCLNEGDMAIPSSSYHRHAPPFLREPISVLSKDEGIMLNSDIHSPPWFGSHLCWTEHPTTPGRRNGRALLDNASEAFSHGAEHSPTDFSLPYHHTPSVLTTHHINDSLPPHQHQDIPNESGKNWGLSNPTKCDMLCGFTGTPHRSCNLTRHLQTKHSRENHDFGRNIHSVRRDRALQLSRRLLCGLGATLCALGETDIGQEGLSGCCQIWYGGTSTQLATKLLCAVGFTVCIACICRSNSDDKYQDHWLVFAIVVGVASGILMGMSLQDAALKILPWTVIVSLLGSAVMHAMLPHFTANYGISERGLLECSEK